MFLMFSSSIRAEQCLVEYEDIDVTGTIAREVFAGPPNYESIGKGDARQVYWILTTDKLYCGKGINPESGGLYDIDGTFKRIQIILTKEQYSDYRPLLSKRVRVSGKAVAAITGHHKTKMLLNVSSIEQLDNMESEISYEKLQAMENHYKKLLISAINNALAIIDKKDENFDPKIFDVIATCHLASINAWPVKLRMEMLEIYSRNSSATTAMKSFEDKLDEHTKTKSLTPNEVIKYVHLQILIYDGCAEKVNTGRSKSKLKSAGIIDYY